MSGPIKDAETNDNVEHVHEALYLPRDVARLLNIHPVTLVKYADQGRIFCIRTPGGHRRYPASVVRAAMEGRWDEARQRTPEMELHYKDNAVVYVAD